MVVMNESMREEVLREKIRARDTLGGNAPPSESNAHPQQSWDVAGRDQFVTNSQFNLQLRVYRRDVLESCYLQLEKVHQEPLEPA